MKELGPDEGINRLKHPDCRACAEYERLLRGVAEENRQLKAKLELQGGDADVVKQAACASVRRDVAEAGVAVEGGPGLAELLDVIGKFEQYGRGESVVFATAQRIREERGE